MAFISNGTTVASGGSLQNIPAPSASQVASGTASISANAVGSYALLKQNMSGTNNGGSTIAGSSCAYANVTGQHEPYTNRSGTWRTMGRTTSDSNESKTTVMLRIS